MMAKQVVLTAEDWVYKCEGLGNVILSYVGSDSDVGFFVPQSFWLMSDRIQM